MFQHRAGSKDYKNCHSNQKTRYAEADEDFKKQLNYINHLEKNEDNKSYLFYCKGLLFHYMGFANEKLGKEKDAKNYFSESTDCFKKFSDSQYVPIKDFYFHYTYVLALRYKNLNDIHQKRENNNYIGEYKKKFEKAEEEAEKLSTEKMDFIIDTLYYEGLAYREFKKDVDAIEAFNKILKKSPSCLSAYYERGLTYRSKEKFDEAISDFEKADSIIKDENAVAYDRNLINIECFVLNEKENDEIRNFISIFNQTIKRLTSKESDDIYYYKGLIYREAGDYNKRRENYEKSIEYYGKSIENFEEMERSHLDSFRIECEFRVKYEIGLTYLNEAYCLKEIPLVEKNYKEDENGQLNQEENKKYTRICRSLIDSEKLSTHLIFEENVECVWCSEFSINHTFYQNYLEQIKKCLENAIRNFTEETKVNENWEVLFQKAIALKELYETCYDYEKEDEVIEAFERTWKKELIETFGKSWDIKTGLLFENRLLFTKNYNRFQPLKLWPLLDKGKFLITSHNFKEAINTFERVIKICEIDGYENDNLSVKSDALFFKGIALRELHKYYDSLEVFCKMLKITKTESGNENYSHVYYNMGLVYCGLQQYEEAIKYYEKTEKILNLALIEKGQTLKKIGNENEAKKAFENVIELAENNGKYEYKFEYKFNTIGLSYLYLENYLEARKNFLKALYVEKLPITLNNLGLLYLEYGLKQKYYVKQELNPEQGRSENKTPNVSEYFKVALHYFNEALKIDQRYTFALNNKGLVLYELNRFADAVEAFNESIIINGYDTFSRRNKGIVLYSNSRYEEALKEFEKAIKINRYNNELIYTKAKILMEINKYGQALEAFQEFRELKNYENLHKDCESLNPSTDYPGFYKNRSLKRLLDEKFHIKAQLHTVHKNPILNLQQISDTDYYSILLSYYQEGRAYYEVGECKKAIELFDIIAYSKKNDYTKIIDSANKETKKNIDYIEDLAKIFKGFILCELGKNLEAKHIFCDVIAHDKKNSSVRDLDVLGTFCSSDCNYSAAETARIFLGKLFINFNDLINANLIVNKVIQDNPINHEAWCLKGHIYLEKGRYDEALDCLEKAIKQASLKKVVYPVWHAYIRYLKAEIERKTKTNVNQKRCDDEIISIIRNLEKINFLAEKEIKTSKNSCNLLKKLNSIHLLLSCNCSEFSHKCRKILIWLDKKKIISLNYKIKKIHDLEITRVYILYFLACLYCKMQDFSSANLKLDECVKLTTGNSLKASAQTLRENIWDDKIRPIFFIWWLCSPDLKIKMSGYLIVFLIILMSYEMTQQISFMYASITSISIIPLLILLFIFISPSIVKISTSNIEIDIKQPVSITEFYPQITPLEYVNDLKQFEVVIDLKSGVRPAA